MSNVKILLFIITLTLGPLNNYGRPQFVAGNLDLESTDRANREISLSGEWLSLDESGDPAGYVRFPHPGKATLPKSGKYRISLSSAVPGEKMLLRTDSLTGIHAFFIDDLYIGRKGVSGSTAAPLPFTVPAKEFTITVEVSDSHQTISDPRGSIYLTTPELYNRRMQIMGMEEFIFSGYTVLRYYHLHIHVLSGAQEEGISLFCPHEHRAVPVDIREQLHNTQLFSSARPVHPLPEDIPLRADRRPAVLLPLLLLVQGQTAIPPHCPRLDAFPGNESSSDSYSSRRFPARPGNGFSV